MVLAGPMTVKFATVDPSSADPHCSTVIPQLIPMVEAVASIELTIAFNGDVDGESVCPLTP